MDMDEWFTGTFLFFLWYVLKKKEMAKAMNLVAILIIIIVLCIIWKDQLNTEVMKKAGTTPKLASDYSKRESYRNMLAHLANYVNGDMNSFISYAIRVMDAVEKLKI